MSNHAGPSSSLSALVRWRFIFLLMGFAALGHFNRVCISVAGAEVFIPKYGIDKADMGLIYTAFLVVYTIGMLPGGWLIDRIGAARALTLYGLSMGTLGAVTGLVGWFTMGTPALLWLALLIVRSVAGVCNSPLHPGAAHVVSDLISGPRRATANGMVTAGALIGVASSYPVFGWLKDQYGWPWAFIISGMTLVAFACLWMSLSKPIISIHQPVEAEPQVHMGMPELVAFLRQGNIWWLTFSYAAFGYFQYLFFYWLDYYFKEVLKVEVHMARNASFYITLAQGAGMALGGISTDAICHVLGVVRGRRVIVMTGMGLSALFGLIAVNLTGFYSIALMLALAMGALGICEGVFWTTATDVGGKYRGFSGAFLNTGGNIGGLISPYLTPVIADPLGWNGAIAVACGISALGGLVWFCIKPSGDRTDFAMH